MSTISGTPITLWCWVRGSTSSIFDITVGRDNRVSELKKAIKATRKPRFDQFASDELKLLKLKNPVDDEHISDIQNLTLQDDKDENDNVILMKDMRRIGNYWSGNQEPPEVHIHVIVEAPEQPGAGLVTLEHLDDKLDLLRSDFGNVYESSARIEIAKISGIHYSSKFEVYDLNGLARLSLPRKQFSNEKPKYESPIYVQASRADKLSNYIYHMKMKTKLEESIRYIRSLPQNNNFIEDLNKLADRAEKALNYWKAHEEKNKSSANRLYLANTKFLGVMLITSYIMDPKIAIENNHAPFNEVLELDVRGRSTSYLDTKNVSIELGEIKLTTKNLRHGYRQLLIRLATLGFAVEALNSKDDEVADYKCDLVGILYVPKVPSNIDIPSKWENGIKFPKGSNHNIRIVAVGEKS